MKTGETRWAIVYSVVLVLITSIPYLIASFAPSPGWVFTGFLVASDDGNSYIAKMLSGAEGAWIFRSPYSTVEQTGVLAFFPYLLVGKLSNGSHGQLVALYHLLRVASIPMLVFAIYRFGSLFIESIALRK